MVADSQEDDSDDGHDAKLARMLQDEEDAKVASSSKTPSFGVDHLGSTPRSMRSSHRGNINVSSSKTKKEVIADSEDDGFDDSPDATLARKLQTREYGEEDSEKEAATSNVRALGLRRSLRRLNSSPVRASSKATGKSTAVAKGKQAAPTRNSTRRGVAQSSTQVLGFRTAKDLIADSQDDDDDFDSLSAFESDDNDSDVSALGGRPSAAQKGKGKAIAPPAESEDENDSDDSVPSLPEEADEMSVLGTGSYVSIDEDPDFLLPPNLQASVHGSDDDEDATLGAHIAEAGEGLDRIRAQMNNRRAYRSYRSNRRVKKDRLRLEKQHPELTTMWKDLENMPVLKAGRAEQPKSISRQLKPFQLEGLAWMTAMEKTEWKGGLLGDEMGLVRHGFLLDFSLVSVC